MSFLLGRFDREIELGIPDEEARVRILQVLTQKLKLEGEFDYRLIAHKTPGLARNRQQQQKRKITGRGAVRNSSFPDGNLQNS